MANYHEWIAGVRAAAKQSEVGKLALANNFQITHTGGGCLCWERLADKGYFWICDEGNGLGDTLDEAYMVGRYDDEGEEVAFENVQGLQAAIDWVNARD